MSTLMLVSVVGRRGMDQFVTPVCAQSVFDLNVGAASNPDNTESNLYTYDIMIRHCFGNYFDILKEMTYSPKTGEQFSFVDSASTRIAWDTSGEMVFPDENYAREVRFIIHNTFGPGCIPSNANR
jgi:hypothetical protein